MDHENLFSIHIYLKPVFLKINKLASIWLILRAPSQTNQNTVSQEWADDQLSCSSNPLSISKYYKFRFWAEKALPE